MVTTSKSESSRTDEPLYRLLKVLRGSLLLSTIAIGVGLLLIGAVFELPVQFTSQDGVIAGMLGVFGVSSIVSAGSVYLALWRIRRD
ncbi:hypothetical protein GWG54_09845 [Natronococcus sp. JC468]|uniref:hypothetical protein n=1 Tax=Natronococcus sp. JC468 TaxID=1961921 RepID=UPI00143C8278|nr:hypothetical protein [Natronococcus sp. JC468]NKE36114.1 hypothetical protein [Natronococcus sp. JC468]